jgi:Protein of unknown function (DUF2865)
LRIELTSQRVQRCAKRVAGTFVAVALLLAPRGASAENLFDFFFGGLHKLQTQANFFDPFQSQQGAPAPRPNASGSGPAFCVRNCDGKYFPLVRGTASPVQMCQAFCPASPTKVFFGGNIDSAITLNGERYADSENAFAYRKALRADCTCNGHDAAGLAPVDLTLDSSLRAGDVIATTDGLVAYSGIKVGNSQSPEFTPVASYPGLTADMRARLGEMKVTPITAETVTNEASRQGGRNVAPPEVTSAKPAPLRDKRAQLN